MTEIIHPVRAAYGYIETKRVDKGGRVHAAKDQLTASHGVFSAKEMEQVMREVAKDVGASEDQIRVVPYQKGQAPIESNPRHRGIEPKMIVKGERRRMYGGYGPGIR